MREKSDLEIAWDEYQNIPIEEREVVIDDVIFYKIISSESLSIQGSGNIIIIVIPASSLKISYDTNYVYDINGLQIKILSQEYLNFVDTIPEWYLNTISLVVEQPYKNYDIGEYIYFKKKI